MPRSPRTAPQKVRIIGGRWKRWQLPVAHRPGLRPTPDRVRETLFSWLLDALPGARCLDLFAGTGVLGLEALSRGASHAHFIESDTATARGLREQLARLQCHEGTVVVADALSWLAGPPPMPFDIVFLDPPYHSDCLAACCARLAAGPWLARGACLYLEFGGDEAPPLLPAGWRVHRETRAGQVQAWLCRTGD